MRALHESCLVSRYGCDYGPESFDALHESSDTTVPIVDGGSEGECPAFEDTTCKACAVEPAAAEVKKKLGLQHSFNVEDGSYCVRWVVDSRRLKSMDREAASPTFDLYFAGAIPFRIILHPKSAHDNKGGNCFKKSQGVGRVELRCLESMDGLDNPVVTFRVSVGSKGLRGYQRPRAPVTHNFSERPIAGLSEGQDTWNFNRAVEKPSKTFEVCIAILRN